MKKLSSILIILGLTTSVLIHAQENYFLKGDQVINIGIGLGSTFYTGNYYKSTIPPVSVSFEKGILDEVLEKGVIGIGGYLGYSSFKYEYMDWGWKYTNLIIGARGTFHYPLLDKFDTYTGIMIGFNIVSAKEFGTTIPGYDYNSTGSDLLWSWYAGGRYYFQDKFAIMGEIGYGITYLNLGIALKL